MRPLKALINIDNAKHNLNYVRSLAPSSKIMATLKANAYGHGLTLMAGAFNEADAFSVLTIEDAIELREAGFDKKILLLEGAFDEEDLKIAAAYHFDLVVHNDYQLALIRQLPHDKQIDIHLKINTGMNRLGFSINAINKVYKQLKNDDRINEIVFMSHFANADKTNGTDEQYQLIENLMNDFNEPFSIANSAALISDNKTHADWVRPGIMLYGATPFDFSQKIPDLKPVMTLRSEVISIQEIKKGQGVGYGEDFVASKDMRIATVACGYADGYPRHAPTGTPVVIDGIKTKTVGRVSMDMLAVDITDLGNVNYGSMVELWGEQLSVDEVANNAKTVGYELLCAISSASRVPIDINYG